MSDGPAENQGMALSSFVLRLSLQHRALYCYLVLSVWILILLGVMYKYISLEDESLNLLRLHGAENSISSTVKQFKFSIKSRKVVRACNHYSEIKAVAEGNFNANYSLEGVFILIRHGDRGPLTHVQNISNVNCGGVYEPLYAAYENYIYNVTRTSSHSVLSQLIGNFHGIPLLPSSDCGLGLLTRVGASQLLMTGKVLGEVYSKQLKTNGSMFKDDVKVYSTRYRRTFQSGLAFLFGFLQKELFPKVSVQEAPSLAFCFDDCACPAADLYLKRAREERDLLIESRPSLMKLVRDMSAVVYEVPDKRVSSDPHALKDALLTYICHNAQFPCTDPHAASSSCVRTEDVVRLFSYLEWESQQLRANVNLKKNCFLRAYGLLKNIVSYLLRIVSERRPKFVLYSGHDKTISFLATALGIRSNGVLSPFYASRLVIEMYKTHDKLPNGGPVGSNYFFRIVYNGKDVTRELKFCKMVDNVYSSPQGQTSSYSEGKFYLCPIESIVRFLHEDYFSIFNATNIKDACALPP